jgi:hypothetical protein
MKSSKLLKEIEKENDLALTKLMNGVQEKVDEMEKIKEANKDSEDDGDYKYRKALFDLNNEIDSIISEGFKVLYEIQDRLEAEQKRLGIYVGLNENIVDTRDMAQLPLEIIRTDNVQTGKCPRCNGDLDSSQNKCSCSQIIAWPA